MRGLTPFLKRMGTIMSKRMRRKKNLIPRMEHASEYYSNTPNENKSKWSLIFGNSNPIHLEIGCGKGLFINTLARQNPEINYIAMERCANANVIAAERAMAEGHKNLLFITADAVRVADMFENEISRIYINFCDPWPLNRSVRKRLTHADFLMLYKKVLTENGELCLKTDNDGLFEFSLAETKRLGYMLLEKSFDLHLEDIPNIKTEYEIKFSEQGIKIKYARFSLYCGTEKACEILKSGGVVALPTETVYGLAADALNESAVEKIFEAKGRPQDNPLIVHISNYGQVKLLAENASEDFYKITKAFWPGPLTVILNKTNAVPKITTAGLETVAVRMPAHRVIREIIEKSNLCLAAPSANISGKPSPTTAEHVVSDLGGKIEGIVNGGVCEVGVESTVLDMTVLPYRILRPGAVTLEQIGEILPNVAYGKGDNLEIGRAHV